MGQQILWILSGGDARYLAAETSLRAIYPRARNFDSISALRQALAESDEARHAVLFLCADPFGSDSLLQFLRGGTTRGVVGGGAVVLTAVADRELTRALLHAGAADVLALPLAEATLRGKVDHWLARTAAGAEHRIEFDPLHATLVTGGRRSLPLTLKEYQIVYYLNQSPGRTATRSELLQSLWAGSRVERKTVDMHISNLRKKVLGADLRINYQNPDSFRLDFANAADELRKTSPTEEAPSGDSSAELARPPRW